MSEIQQAMKNRKKLQRTGQRVLSVLLSLIMVLSGMLTGMPVMSVTAYANAPEGAYAEYIANTDDEAYGEPIDKLVTFNEMQWYIIEDNSTSQSEGTVTLLLKDYVGTSVFGNSAEYVGSTVQSYLSEYYRNYFSGLDDAVVDGGLGRLYLLSVEEASVITNQYVLRCAEYEYDSSPEELGAWWLRSKSGEGMVSLVGNHIVGIDEYGNWYGHTYCVRPALKLNLAAVTFSPETRTFTLRGQEVHTHSFTYAANGNTITATCSASGCSLTEKKATLTISAEGGIYNGVSAYGATITDVNRIKGNAAVQYYVCNQNGTRGNALDPITTAPKDAGRYWAEITLGTGAQAATAHVTYTIAKADPVADPPEVTTSYGKTLGDITLSNPEGNTDGTWTFEGDGSTSVGEAGTHTFKANFTPEDTNNYNAVSDVDITVTVNKENPSLTAPQATAIYGQTLGDITLVNPEGNTDGTWTFEGGGSTSVGDVGTHTFKATFTPTDSTNYSTVSNVDITVTVNKANPGLTAPQATATYGQTLGDITLVNPNGNIEGSWSFQAAGTTSVGAVGEHTFKASFTPEDTTNYNTVNNVDVKVVVGKAKNPAKVESAVTVRKGGTSIDLAKNVTMNGAAGAVSFEISGEAGGCTLSGSVLTTSDAAGSVTVIVTVAEDEHYKALEGSVVVTITDKLTQTINASDVTATYGDTGISVSANTVSGNGVISYSVKEGSGDYIAIDAASGALTIKKAGTATVLVTAAETNEYAQTVKEVTVTILRAGSTVTKAPTAASLIYTGSAQQLAAMGTAAGGTLQYALGTESEVTGAYSANVPSATNAGTYYVWYKVVGDENHKDTTPASVKVKLAKANGPAKVEKTATAYIDGKSLDLSLCVTGAAGNVTYAVKEALEGCSVDANTGFFTQGSKEGDCVVTVSIAESGNYEAQTEEIRISVVNKIPAILDVIQEDCVYGQTLPQPVYYIKGTTEAPTGGKAQIAYTGNLKKDGSAYSSGEAPTEAGAYRVDVSYETDTMIYTGSAAFQIKPFDIRDAVVTLSESELTYTGSEQTVNVTGVTLGDQEFSSGEYTVIGNQATDADVYTLTVSANAAGNYTGFVTKAFTIKKATPYVKTQPTAAGITYGQSLEDSALSGGKVQVSETIETAVSGTFAWKEPETTPSVVSSDGTTYEVIFTPNDTRNLESVTIEASLKIAKAGAAPNLPASTMEVPYNVKEAGDITLFGEWRICDEDRETELTVGKAVVVTAVYTGGDLGSYNTESVRISVTRKELSYANLVPTAEDVSNGETIDKVVTFNEMQWYLIEDHSASQSPGTVTLLLKDYAGTSRFGDTTEYAGSTVQKYLEEYYKEHFEGLDDAVVDGEFGRLYLLSTEEAKAISNKEVIKCTEYELYISPAEMSGWWLRTPVNAEDNKVVIGNNYNSSISEDYGENIGFSLCVRPALKLNLEAVTFSFETKTFTMKAQQAPAGDDTVKVEPTTPDKTDEQPAKDKEQAATPGTPDTPGKQDAGADQKQNTTETPDASQDQNTTGKAKAVGTKLSAADPKAEYTVISKEGEEPSVEYRPAAGVKDKTIKIPESITKDGVTYQVTTIADNAFKGNKTVQTIVIPACVTKIGNNAFSGCKNLKTITIGKNVKKLGGNLFKSCKKLKTINIKAIGLTADNVNKKTFKGLGNKVIVKVPKKLKKAYLMMFRKKGLSKKVKVK